MIMSLAKKPLRTNQPQFFSLAFHRLVLTLNRFLGVCFFVFMGSPGRNFWGLVRLGFPKPTAPPRAAASLFRLLTMLLLTAMGLIWPAGPMKIALRYLLRSRLRSSLPLLFRAENVAKKSPTLSWRRAEEIRHLLLLGNLLCLPRFLNPRLAPAARRFQVLRGKPAQFAVKNEAVVFREGRRGV